MKIIKPEDNWKKIKAELSKLPRPGMEKLIAYLEKGCDFRTAPASTKFHLCVEGGLTEHSINVLNFGRIVNKELNLDEPDESIIITTLLHDLCKVNYYVMGEEWDKEWKDKTNQWRKKSVWKVDDQIPLGHGEKSLALVIRHIPLTKAEMLAIRWHMSAFEAGTHFPYPSGFPFRQSIDKFPLVQLLIIADQIAQLHEATNYNEKMAKEGTHGQPGLPGAENSWEW